MARPWNARPRPDPATIGADAWAMGGCTRDGGGSECLCQRLADPAGLHRSDAAKRDRDALSFTVPLTDADPGGRGADRGRHRADEPDGVDHQTGGPGGNEGRYLRPAVRIPHCGQPRPAVPHGRRGRRPHPGQPERPRLPPGRDGRADRQGPAGRRRRCLWRCRGPRQALSIHGERPAHRGIRRLGLRPRGGPDTHEPRRLLP